MTDARENQYRSGADVGTNFGHKFQSAVQVYGVDAASYGRDSAQLSSAGWYTVSV